MNERKIQLLETVLKEVTTDLGIVLQTLRARLIPASLGLLITAGVGGGLYIADSTVKENVFTGEGVVSNCVTELPSLKPPILMLGEPPLIQALASGRRNIDLVVGKNEHKKSAWELKEVAKEKYSNAEIRIRVIPEEEMTKLPYDVPVENETNENNCRTVVPFEVKRD